MRIKEEKTITLTFTEKEASYLKEILDYHVNTFALNGEIDEVYDALRELLSDL